MILILDDQVFYANFARTGAGLCFDVIDQSREEHKNPADNAHNASLAPPHYMLI